MAGGVALALVRGLTVAGLLCAFGTLVFRVFVAPRALARMPAATVLLVCGQLRWTAWAGAAGAGAAALAWLALQAADMTDAGSWRQALAAVPAVLSGTAFGHVIALQLAALALGAAVLAEQAVRRWSALLLFGAAVALQTGHSHAAAMGSAMDGAGKLLVACDALHLLAAGAWLGGLLPLLLLVRAAPPRAGAAAARWFSPMGQLCVAALAATSLAQGWVLVGSIPGLVGTAYGGMALVKLGLFGVLLGFAWVNRYRFAPALLGGHPAAAQHVLVRSVALQTAAGAAIVAAAAVLSSLAPAMHEQPLWPFASRFTLETIGEDPDLHREVVGALLVLACAVGLAGAAAVIRRRVRWLAAAAALVAAWFAVPHLDLLFVPATPTSYYRSPTGFAAAAIMRGAALYPGHCAGCHGADGHGGGPGAAGLPVPPADLTAAHLWMHSDGELFWWLSHGIEAPEGGLAMPGFAASLSDDDRWALIDAIRARNAGLAFQGTGAWPVPLQAPNFAAECPDGPLTLADLRGGFVRVVAGEAAAMPGVTTVLIAADRAVRPAAGLCVAADDSAMGAFALVAGLPGSAIAGSQFLIDGQGWLRAMQAPGAGQNWNAGPALAAELHKLQASPAGAAPAMAPMRM